jgi:Tetratricopeptide repeat
MRVRSSLGLPSATLSLGQLADAITCLRESLNTQRAVDDRRHEAVTRQRLGRCQVMTGDRRDAHHILAEALRLWEELGETACAAETRAILAGLIGSAGDGDVIGAGK